MKILILANNDVGLYKFRLELIEELLKQHELVICLPNGGFVQKLEAMGCRFIPCDFDRHGTNPLKELQLRYFYQKIIKKERPDMVFTYTIKPNIYGGMACASLNVPYVANITGMGTAVETPGLMQKVTLILYKFGLRKARKVFFQNTENQEFILSKGVVKGPHDLLPGSGVNLNRYSVSDYPKSETVDFVFIARVMKEKGADQYFEAAKYIKQKYPHTRFHVCGACEQNYEEMLKSLQDEGVIIYHGLVDDIAAVHKISSCTIHPTYYPEGMSNVLLESCACGRPIITTDRSGCREIVDDGVNGFVVKQKDSQDLIAKIEKFLSLSWEERKAMGLAGREKVEQQFNRQIVLAKYFGELNV